MIKKALSILICTLILLMGVPFKSLAAFSISQSNIQGVNVSVVDYKVIGENDFNPYYPKSTFILKFEVVMDNVYLGYLTGKFTCNIFGYDAQGNSLQINVDSGNKSYYICGRSLTYYVEQTLYYSNTPTNTFTNVYNPSFTLAGSNVTDINYTGRMLEDIEDILYNAENIYTSVYDPDNGTVIEQLVDVNEELDFIHEMVYYINNNVANIENDTDIISKMRQFSVPIYSYNMVISGFNNLDLYEMGTRQLGYRYFDYPIFIIHPNQRVNIYASFYLPNDVDGLLIYGTSGNLNTITNTVYNIVPAGNGTLNIKQANNLYNWTIPNINTFEMKRIYFTASTNTIRFNIYNNTGSDLYFVPIYFGRGDITFDTEFANIYGLIDKSYEEALDNNTDQMQSEFNDLFTIEDDYGDQLNNQLNNIDFTNPLQNNSSMLSSGNFVIQVFNGLIANNPLSILIIIVCIFFVARRLFG